VLQKKRGPHKIPEGKIIVEATTSIERAIVNISRRLREKAADPAKR
jgi:hypothetical protein